jgi:phosphatidylglycerol lysyltransferase
VRLEEGGDGTLARARAIVLAHGWNTTAYQILNPGFRYWFDPAGDAVAGVVATRSLWVVAGAPVAPASRLAAVAARLEADATAVRARVCYVAAQERLERALQPRMDSSLVHIGAEPCWDPAGWERIISSTPSLRAQVARSRNKGVEVAEGRLGTGPAEEAIGGVLREWLETRGLPPLGFLTLPWLLGRLEDRRLFIARRSGTPVAFAILSPVPGRNGWLVEQIARRPSAPNGVGEQLVDAAFRRIAAEGARFASLGIVPLSRRSAGPDAAPWWLRGAFAWGRAHGRRFYNVDGLERFKAKLRPDGWLAAYAIFNAPAPTLPLLWGMLEAVVGGPPLAFLAQVAARALRMEWRTLRGGMGKGERGPTMGPRDR